MAEQDHERRIEGNLCVRHGGGRRCPDNGAGVPAGPGDELADRGPGQAEVKLATHACANHSRIERVGAVSQEDEPPGRHCLRRSDEGSEVPG